MLILKFGGSSVGNAQRIQNVAKIIQNAHKSDPVVVVSAVQGITDLLLNTAKLALTQDSTQVQKNLASFFETHHQIIQKNLVRKSQKRAINILKRHLKELENLYHGIEYLRELSPRTLDLIASYGERVSSYLLSFTLENIGLRNQRFNSKTLIRTDENFGNGEVNWTVTQKQFQKNVLPITKKGIIPLITGYFGACEKEEIVTLGRGGSDYSAAIAAVSLHAKEIQIWTDVDGIMTTDPRLIPHALIIPHISFQEAAELAYFGAKVLHPKTIQPAIEKNIPVRILNTFNPENQGTLITQNHLASQKTVKAIAFQKNTSVVNISSLGMLGQHGFLAKTFSVFEKHKISVDVVATSEVSISLTIDDKDLSDQLINELNEFSQIKTIKDQALICIVGNGIKNDIQSESRIFQILAKNEITTELVSKGASQINLTFVIEKKYLEKAIKALHKELLE